MNIPKGCKPFNYEEAVKDLSKVNVPIGHLHKTEDNSFFVAVFQDGSIGTYYMSGKGVDSNSFLDLFLKDEVVVYKGVGQRSDGSVFMSPIDFERLEFAIKQCNNGAFKSISAQTYSNGEIIKCETVHKY